MKNTLLYILLFVTLSLGAPKAHAQYVTIPDTNFVAWLNEHGVVRVICITTSVMLLKF